LLGAALRFEPMTGENAEERGGYRRNGVNDSFGIASTVVEVAEEELAVAPGGKVLDLIHERNVATGNASARDGYKT